MSSFIKSNKRESGFTLIELLLVITILGFMVAMVVPFANHQDKESKIKETNQIFEEIRMAILGARNSFDAEGNRVIGGYVGDVGHLPKLYVYEWDDTNDKWTHPDTTPADGEPDTTANNDPGTPIAGEKNAEPAALWKGTLPGGYAADALKEEGWKGPYMARPKDRFRDDQVWDYIASPSTADDFEQNRKFRLREAEGRLSDAWGKTLIIYVEDGSDSDTAPDMDSGNNPLNLVFVSAGLDGRYDASDPADLTKSYNEDNLVLKIDQHEWDDSEEKTMATRNLLLRIKEAIVGDSPGGINNGFSGDVCRWPKLFRWEDNGTPGDPTDDYWDDEDDGPDPGTPAWPRYTKGQSRELWTRKPNSSGSDDVYEMDSDWAHAGTGWRHEYLQHPWAIDDEQFVRDAWNRRVHFFKDDSNDAVMILSSGADGKFNFGIMNSNNTEPASTPASLTEDLDVAAYNPHAGYNEDNIVLIVRGYNWHPGYFKLNEFTVLNATIGTTKVALFYDESNLPQIVDSLGFTLEDADGDTLSDDWVFNAVPAFNRNDIRTGLRSLVFWNDTNLNPGDTPDVIDSLEMQHTVKFNVFINTPVTNKITVDTGAFTSVP
ncbi:MAG: prepilin-type N-terminal cleavage/methylation domain-containing protein [Proteobacteria bacterium]|nr:prepilin-type N-terminal cleavage/methylation domain-containing protein [Pseudomonadota bacterium]